MSLEKNMIPSQIKYVRILLSFPFESYLLGSEIFSILNSRLNHITPFEIRAKSLSVFDHWLVLNLTHGIKTPSVKEVVSNNQQVKE